MSEDEEMELELKLSKYIKEMDSEIADRFKAIKVLQDDLRDADEEQQKEIRKLELQFEDKYKEIYAVREQLVNGKAQPDAQLVKAFDDRAKEM